MKIMNEQELFAAVKNIKKPDEKAINESKEHWLQVAKPLFSLGKFEGMVTKIAGIQGSAKVNIDKKALIIMCADNGIVEEGVTQSGQGVTAVVTHNFTCRATSVCFMAERAGVRIFPVDVGVAVDVEGVSDKDIKVAYGTKNFAKGPAMTREEAVRAIAVGIHKVKELKDTGYKIIATGEMGIGNTTTSSAIAAVLLEQPVEAMTGKGAGLSSEGLKKKINTIKNAIVSLNPDKNDPIDVLSKVGGLDIAGLMGVFLGGAIYQLPIVVDGFISAVSAMLAKSLNPSVMEYVLASHVSKEPAGASLLEELGISPVITADMCLGEGTGAVALFPLLDMIIDVYQEMTTFDEWNGQETYEILL